MEIGVHVTDYTLAQLAYSGVKSPSLHQTQPPSSHAPQSLTGQPILGIMGRPPQARISRQQA